MSFCTTRTVWNCPMGQFGRLWRDARFKHHDIKFESSPEVFMEELFLFFLKPQSGLPLLCCGRKNIIGLHAGWLGGCFMLYDYFLRVRGTAFLSNTPLFTHHDVVSSSGKAGSWTGGKLRPSRTVATRSFSALLAWWKAQPQSQTIGGQESTVILDGRVAWEGWALPHFHQACT